MKDNAVEKLQSVDQPQLQCALYNRANKRLETRVGVRDFQPVAGANNTDRQHPGRMDELNRSVDWIAADQFLFRMIVFPLCWEIEGRILEGFTVLRDQIFDGCHR